MPKSRQKILHISFCTFGAKNTNKNPHKAMPYAMSRFYPFRALSSKFMRNKEHFYGNRIDCLLLHSVLLTLKKKRNIRFAFEKVIKSGMISIFSRKHLAISFFCPIFALAFEQ